jgi:hypothetical protein
MEMKNGEISRKETKKSHHGDTEDTEKKGRKGLGIGD